MGFKEISAIDVKVGDKVPERDGFLFDVISVRKSASGKTVDITFASDFSSIPAHHKQNGGVTQRYRCSSKLYISQ